MSFEPTYLGPDDDDLAPAQPSSARPPTRYEPDPNLRALLIYVPLAFMLAWGTVTVGGNLVDAGHLFLAAAGAVVMGFATLLAVACAIGSLLRERVAQ